MKVSVIISTYNNPKWLEKVLCGLSFQEYKDFEVLIADDGSKEDTKTLVEECRKKYSLDIKHVWHEDLGFRKTAILNKAVKQSTGDYIIFTDGDCIPRRDFIKTHVDNSEKGYFLSGGAFRLPMNVSELISEDDIKKAKAFDIKWLKQAGVPCSFKLSKLLKSKCLTFLLNAMTPTKATWNGGNASTWREYLVELNGFNEDMHYGAEDREFGSRLKNFNIKSKQIRYSAICIHLEHSRGYVNKEHLNENKSIWKEAINNKIIKISNGIEKL